MLAFKIGACAVLERRAVTSDHFTIQAFPKRREENLPQE